MRCFTIWAALVSAAFLFLSGCAGNGEVSRLRLSVEAWALPLGFVPSLTGSEELPLFMLERGEPSSVLHVYIEGDGAAWHSPWQAPRDPTPERPLGLRIAAQDGAPAVVYLGRPCQYLDAAVLAACSPRYWTSHRFSADVVAVYRRTINDLKVRYGARRVVLFGYSGGGVLALLLAASSDDLRVVTIAAPASLAAWVAWHRLSPLEGSLDPMKRVERLESAIHFVGGRDRIVPPEVVSPFVMQSGGRMRVVPDFDHECCWSRDWRNFLEEIR